MVRETSFVLSTSYGGGVFLYFQPGPVLSIWRRTHKLQTI